MADAVWITLIIVVGVVIMSVTNSFIKANVTIKTTKEMFERPKEDDYDNEGNSQDS